MIACASISNAYGLTCRCIVMIAFALAAFLSAFLALKLKGTYNINLKSLAIILFSQEIFMLAAAWAVGIHLESSFEKVTIDLNRWEVILVGTLMGGAMGFHNAAAKESIPNCPATTVMTTTIVTSSTALSNALTLYLSTLPLLHLTPPNGLNGSYLPLSPSERISYKKATRDAWTKFVVSVKPLITFAIGAVVGAILTTHLSFYSISIPIAILILILIDVNFAIQREMAEKEGNLGTLLDQSTDRSILVPELSSYQTT